MTCILFTKKTLILKPQNYLTIFNMKKPILSPIFVLSCAIFIGTFLYSCSQKNNESQSENIKNDSIAKAFTKDSLENCIAKKPEGNFTDPNQPSELAALMREMFVEAEKMQIAVKADKIPDDLRTKFAAMKTAKPTEPEMTEAPFGDMAKVFLTTMDKLYEEKNQVEDYNLMVQSCLACHQNQCPGPMVRIKKLLIKL